MCSDIDLPDIKRYIRDLGMFPPPCFELSGGWVFFGTSVFLKHSKHYDQLENRGTAAEYFKNLCSGCPYTCPFEDRVNITSGGVALPTPSTLTNGLAVLPLYCEGGHRMANGDDSGMRYRRDPYREAGFERGGDLTLFAFSEKARAMFNIYGSAIARCRRG